MNYTFPPPAFNKGIEMVQVTPSYPALTIQDLQRYSAWDPNTGSYFLLTELPGVGEEEYILYTVTVANWKVTSVPLPDAKNLEVTSIQFDSQAKVLFGVFNEAMYSINTATGALTMKGPLNGGSSLQIVPGLCTAFDSSRGLYFIAVDDDTHGTHNLLTYSTRNNSIWLTPSLNDGDYWTLYGMGYDPKIDQMVALTANLRGYPSIKTVNYYTGNHTDLIPEWIWSDYDDGYSLWPLSPVTNQITVLDMQLNIFWITVMWLEPTSYADDDALVYYNLTKGGIEMGSGPMVVYDNAIEFTNYAWFPWKQ